LNFCHDGTTKEDTPHMGHIFSKKKTEEKDARDLIPKFFTTILSTPEHDLLHLISDTDDAEPLFLCRPQNVREEILYIENPSEHELVIGVYWRLVSQCAEHRFIRRQRHDGYIWTFPFCDMNLFQKDIHVLHTDVYFIGSDICITLPDLDNNENITTLRTFFSATRFSDGAVSTQT
jgi:hypothetical protein